MSAKQRAAVRRRRTLLVLVVLLAIAALVLALWQPWRSAPASTEPSPSQSTEPASSPTPTPTASVDPGPSSTYTPLGEEGDAAASGDAPACDTAQVLVTPLTDATTYSAEQRVQLSFEIENTGETACQMNVGTTQQRYEIRSGDDVIYRSTDCQADPVDQQVTLEPGVAQRTVPIEWDRTRSSVDTCTAEREPVPADGASYHLSVVVGEVDSGLTRQFILE